MSPLREEVDAIRWFHSIDLGGGILTPGLDDTSERVEILRLPEDLSGRSVLDVGAWDGFFSFECERRGAARVVAADEFAWTGRNWSDKRGFELARRALGSKVEDVEVDVMDLAPDRVGGTFDVVLLLGVLYHLRHPLLALERVASVTGDLLVLETHVDLIGLRHPAAAFYEHRELDGDPTNWWGPNPAAVCSMLRAAGFRTAEVVSGRSRAFHAGRSARRAAGVLRSRLRGADEPRPWSDLRQGRVVVHARR